MRSGIRAALARVAVLALPAALLTALPVHAAPPATSDPSPGTADFVAAPPRSDEARVSAADRGAAQAHRVLPTVSAVSERLVVGDGVSALGVEWTGESGGVLVQWRFTEPGGAPGEWAEVPVGEHGPDSGSSEERASKHASDPVLTTAAGSVEFRTLGATVPQGIKAFRNDASAPRGAEPTDPTSKGTATEGTTSKGTASGGTTSEGAASEEDAAAQDHQTQRSAMTATTATTAMTATESTTAAAPTIRSRAAWGANESIRKGSPSYGAVKGEVVHHTVNANTYTADQVPAMIRAIYEYHVLRNGWNDIGYNFLIDRFGRIWEGRYGGTTRPVVGAHSPGVNSWTTSAAAIGNFTSSGTTVPAAITTAYRDLFAWKASLHQMDPEWTVNLGGRTQRSISGHRDNVATECPGAALYARIPAITRATSAATPNTPALSVRRDADNWGDNDVLTVDSTGKLALVHANGTGQLQAPEQETSIPPAGFDMLRVAGDWDGDGAVDVLGRLASNGGLYLYAGDGSGGFKTPRKVGTGWNTIRIMTTVGDVTGDRVPDLIAATTADSELRVYPGDGTGSFLRPKVIGYRWNGIRSIVGVGDWDRDGDSDLLGITTSGVPLVYRNAGGGALGNGPRLNFVAPRGAVVTAVGDVTSDSLVDLVVKDETGTVRVAASTADPAAIRWVDQSAATVSTWETLTPHEG